MILVLSILYVVSSVIVTGTVSVVICSSVFVVVSGIFIGVLDKSVVYFPSLAIKGVITKLYVPVSNFVVVCIN